MQLFTLTDRLPLPCLKTYTIVSSVLFSAALLYGKNVLEEYPEGTSFLDVCLTENFCLWANVNMAYCLLFLCGKVIQKFVLGDLRVSEQQHLQDKFWNYVFYKIIFIFGVVNAQSLTEVLCWLAWFSNLGFWHIFGQLCKDRYEFLMSSPNTAAQKHVKLICLLGIILVASVGLGTYAVYYGYPAGLNILAFMMAECLLLGLKSLHILVKYSIQLADAAPAGVWDRKARLVYYVDFTIDWLILTVDLLYHIHMLVWSNVFLSMASLVLYWNIRTILGDMKMKLRKHRMYRKIRKRVQYRLPMATDEELAEFEDHCAICWEAMSSARKLPCSHLFHHSCLCSWLQQDVSCPTCRRSLTNDLGLHDRALAPGVVAGEEEREQPLLGIQENNENDRFRNYFFHLDGTQIANWFPSFSIEVFHRGDGNNEQGLQDMANEVHAMFPNVSQELIMEDLRRTGSAELTAEHILEGQIASNDPEPVEETEIFEERPSIVTTLTPPTDDDAPHVTEILEAPVTELTQSSSEETFPEDGDGRQRLLAYRRQNFLTGARRRYVSKQRDSSPSVRNPAENRISSDDHTHFSDDSNDSAAEGMSARQTDRQNKDVAQSERRAQLLQAVERRHGQQNAPVNTDPP